MKKLHLILMSSLLVFAIAFASCGSTGEKAKNEEAKTECANKKDHECDSVKQDSCKTAKAEDHECDHDHDHEHGEDCDHD